MSTPAVITPSAVEAMIESMDAMADAANALKELKLPAAPEINVAAPTVNVAPPAVHVSAPNVSVNAPASCGWTFEVTSRDVHGRIMKLVATPNK